MGEPDLSLSLNEVEMLAAKASRGAGLAWGLAEDLSAAARWLAARGIDWSPALLGLLEDPAAAERLRGAFLAADRAAGRAGLDGWTTQPCDPVWVVPLLAASLRASPLTWTLAMPEQAIRLRPDGASADAPWVALPSLALQPLVVRVAPDEPPLRYPTNASARRSGISVQAWQGLGRLAARTYVPASPQSRAGAGGGRVDDD